MEGDCDRNFEIEPKYHERIGSITTLKEGGGELNFLTQIFVFFVYTDTENT